MEDTLDIPTQATFQPDPPVKKLWKGLYDSKKYTKSFDEFQKQFSTPEAIAKLHKGLQEDGDYTKGVDDFQKQFFQSVKKNESLPSPSLGGQLPAQNKGQKEVGNVDLTKQPSVDNPYTGGKSTAWSMSIGTDKGEVLIPRVTPDGKVLSEQEAIDNYKKTGKHLGVFDTPESANAYAEKLHNDYESGKIPTDNSLVKDFDPIAASLQYKDLKNKTTSIGFTGASEIPDVDAIKQANVQGDAVKKAGFNPDKLAEDFSGIPEGVHNIPGFSKPELLSLYKDNPQKYERTIGAIKGQSQLFKQINDLHGAGNLSDTEADYLSHDINSSIGIINSTEDYDVGRQNIQRIMDVVNKYGGDKKNDIMRNLGIDFGYVYGKEAGDIEQLSHDERYKRGDINSNQLAAIHYLEDIHPEELRKYQSAFLKDEDIKDNTEAQLGKQEGAKKLDELGIQLRKAYLNEKFNPINKEYQSLIDKSTKEGLTPEEQQRAQELEIQGKPLFDQLQQANGDEQQIAEHYPMASYYDTKNFAQELMGQQNTGIERFLTKTGEAVKNTGAGVYDFAAEPFRSKQEDEIRQAEILGSGKIDETISYLKQSNQVNQTFKPELSKELQADVDKIKKDDSLSEPEKLQATTKLLMSRMGEWQRTPQMKTNIGLKSLMYGISDMAAGLVPFMGIEIATGGGATAGLARKLTSSFVAASASGFEESYRDGIERGEANPYAYATRVTAINSAAIAGAQTPAAIRRMFAGEKTAIGNLVSKMTDSEIEAALKESPKSLKIFGKSVEAIKSKSIQTAKAFGSSTVSGVKDAAKINAFMTGGKIVNDAISGDLKTPTDYGKDFLIETLKFAIPSAVIGGVSKTLKPTDLSKSALYESAVNPDGILSSLEQKLKDGTITPEEGLQVKRNVEAVSKIYQKNSPFFKSLDDKAKREYLYNALTEARNKEAAQGLPERQAEKFEMAAEIAKHKNGLIIEPKTPEQLTKRKEQLEKSLVPEKDAEGKNIEIPEKEIFAAKAEVEAINQVLDEHEKANKNNVTIDIPNQSGESVPLKTEEQTRTENGVTVEPPQSIPEPVQLNQTGQEVNDAVKLLEPHADNPMFMGMTTPEQKLQYIAEQAQGISSTGEPHSTGSARNLMDKTFGKELVDAAIEKYPAKEPPPPTGEGTVNDLPFGNEDTTGIAHGVAQIRSMEVGLPQPVHGEGVTVQEAIQHGQQLLSEGGDADKAAADFQADPKKNISYDALSLVRAKHETLVRAANKAIDEFGENSKQAKDALKAENDWYTKVVKPMQTEWSKIGQAQQGRVDIDTGSYVATKRAIEDISGKPLSDKQAAIVKYLTGKVKELNKKVEDLQKKFTDAVDKGVDEKPETKKAKARQRTQDALKAFRKASGLSSGGFEALPEFVEVIKALVNEGLVNLKEVIDRFRKEFPDVKVSDEDIQRQFNDAVKPDILTKFADKTDNNFTPGEVKEMWDYAKENYIDKGKDVPTMLKGVGDDLGLTYKQVLSALEKPKGAKVISDAMFLAQNRRTAAANKVKEYARTANTPRLTKWLKAIPNFFFRKAIFGHGTVGMITHAGMNIFRPSIAKIYWKNFARQFKNSFGAFTNKGMAEYEKNMEFLKNDPLFITAKRAGVKVDPTEKSDDYTGVKKWLTNLKITGAGDRGFNALKQFRMDYFANEYNRLSDEEKADPETLKMIGKIINHSTGTSDFVPGGAMDAVVFAPRLEASKWARIITDPFKAITTFGRWDKSTLAEKAAAKFMARKTGEVLATYLSALGINAALLYATGSKQKVNWTDPSKKDWLKFKVGGENIDASGGIVSTLDFIGHLLWLIPKRDKNELKGETKGEALQKLGFDYGTSKFSPFASTGKDIITSHDFSGNTLPWSDEKPFHRYNHKLTWKEYLWNNQAPIPVAEASRSIYESMEARGMSEPQISDVLTGIMKGMISGGTGAKVSTDFSVEQKKSGRR